MVVVQKQRPETGLIRDPIGSVGTYPIPSYTLHTRVGSIGSIVTKVPCNVDTCLRGCLRYPPFVPSVVMFYCWLLVGGGCFGLYLYISIYIYINRSYTHTHTHTRERERERCDGPSHFSPYRGGTSSSSSSSSRWKCYNNLQQHSVVSPQ